MTAELLRPDQPMSLVVTHHRRLVVPLIAAIAVVMRLPMLTHAPGTDEAGFLTVGQQWHSGGSSLYGNYWVDRPPLLITIFRLAAQMGGVVPLRLIGCVATVLVVLGSAHVARRVAGDSAAGWTALTAAAMCISPMLGSAKIDGELLAAPFVVGGIAATIAALGAPTRGHVLRAAALAGAAMMAALLIKQNFVDVGVFAAAAGLIAWRRREISTRHLGHLVLGGIAGAAVCLSVVAAWTVAHGTSLTGVFDAMYPFRVAAGHVIAGAGAGHSHAAARFWTLVRDWVVSGSAVVLLLAVWAAVSRRLHGTVALALVAVAAFDIVSVLLGGNYWHHYLLQLVVPISILGGLLVAKHLAGVKPILVTAAVLAAGVWAAMPPTHHVSDDARVGSSIASAALQGDTIFTAYGHAEVNQASGLSSPYPYLWSLPIKTLDPGLQHLDTVLRSPRAPTWVVVWNHVSSWGLTSTETSHLIASNYRPVAQLHGTTIYLRDGIVRPAPDVTAVDEPISNTSQAKEATP